MGDEKGLRQRNQQNTAHSSFGTNNVAFKVVQPITAPSTADPSSCSCTLDGIAVGGSTNDGRQPIEGPILLRKFARRKMGRMVLNHCSRDVQNKRAASIRQILATASVGGVVLFLVLPFPSQVYHDYRAETKPSPFLPRSGLHTSIRGRAPPSDVFEFPSPRERVQFYMGDHWYRSTIPTNVSRHTTDADIMKRICSDVVYWKSGMSERGAPYRFDVENLRRLIYKDWPYRLPWRYDRGHPADAYRFHFVVVDDGNDYSSGKDRTKHRQMLLQFGDGKDSAEFLSTPYPLVVKTRLSPDVYEERFRPLSNTSNLATTSKHTMDLDRYPPIIGMYEMHRHYNDHFRQVDDLWDQIPWSEKKETLIWRGASSGRRRDVVEKYFGYGRPSNHRPNPTPQNNSLRWNGRDVDIDIDIAFSYTLDIHRDKLDHLVRGGLSVPELLSYKYLLSLEGWCMASGLKWMLYSNSVVMMAPPTKVSWAMESTLVPWVHYIPLFQNHSNLPERLAWARTHDDECQQISLHARDYMERLVTSEQAQRDTVTILKEMDRVYQQNFGEALQQCDGSLA